MGTAQPLASIFNGNFQDKNWIVLDKSRKSIPGQPVLVQLQGKQIMADQYIVRLNHPETFSRQSSIYQKRASSNSSSLVNIFSAELLTEKYQLSGQNQVVRVRTQKIPWRLSESKNLSVLQGVYILENALRGYTQILQHFPQPVTINDSMIGMNIFGTVRVWINSNFAKNQPPAYHKPIKMIDMLQSLVLCIEKHLQTLIFPRELRSDILNSYTFNLASIKASNYLLKSKEEKKKIGVNILNKVNQNKPIKHSMIFFDNMQKNKSRSLIKSIEHSESNLRSIQRQSIPFHNIHHNQHLKNSSTTRNLCKSIQKKSLTPNISHNNLLRQSQLQIVDKSKSKQQRNDKASHQPSKPLYQSYIESHYSQNFNKSGTENRKNRNQLQMIKNGNIIQSKIPIEYETKLISNTNVYNSKFQHKHSQLNSSEHGYRTRNTMYQDGHVNSPKIYGKNHSLQNQYASSFKQEHKATQNKNILYPHQQFLNQLKKGNVIQKSITEHKKPLQITSSYQLDKSRTKQAGKDNYISFQVKLQKSGQIKRDGRLATSNVQNKTLTQIGNIYKYEQRPLNKSPEKYSWNQTGKKI